MMILSRFSVLVYLCVFNCNGFLSAVDSAFECKKGEKISRGKGVCEPCPEGTYKAVPNPSQLCDTCTTCFETQGSEFISNCTKTSDTICQCRTGFIRRNNESSICKIDKGSGQDTSGKVGASNSDDNSEPEEKTIPSTHTTSPSGSIQIFSKSLIQSQGSSPHPDVATFAPAPTIKVTQSPKFSTADVGQVMTLFGTVLLLTFLLTAVTCKLVLIPCIKNHKKPAVRTSQDSMCRRPVEESGDNSLSSLVKPPGLGEP